MGKMRRMTPYGVRRSASDDLRRPILCGTNILRSTDGQRGTNILRSTDGLRGNRGVCWWVHIDGEDAAHDALWRTAQRQ